MAWISVVPGTTRFLLEDSAVPIYQRILDALSRTLQAAGCDVVWLRRGSHSGINDVLRFVETTQPDYCLVSNSTGMFSMYNENIDRYLFELIPGRLVFLHHDNLFSDYRDGSAVMNKVRAFRRERERSIHFSIEPYNVTDLRSLGIEHACPLHHASEYQRPDSPRDAWQSSLAFVGHVLPGEYRPGWGTEAAERLEKCYTGRLAVMDTGFSAAAAAFAGLTDEAGTTSIERIARKYWFISSMHAASMYYRGDVISKIRASDIDIIGGDPAYLAGRDMGRKIAGDRVRYLPPVHDYAETAQIYRHTKINLNITSLQFDRAMTNRVVDVIASGGFVLTDNPAELGSLTGHADSIAFRNIDELNDKIDYYLTHEGEREELAKQLHDDISLSCTYKSVVKYIIDGVSAA